MGERTIGDDAPIRLAIVDDHPAIASAIRAAVGTPSAGRPIELVATARSAPEALSLLQGGAATPATPSDAAPDVVLCDIQLDGGAEGLDVLDAAVAAGSRVIVLTAFDRSAFARAAFERGASGFLSKDLEVSAILEAVRTVASGGTAFSSAALGAARAPNRVPSARELAICAGISRGQTSEEIAFGLHISTRTVESHLRRLFDRYGVLSRAELAVLAEREGWLSLAGQ